MTALVRDAGRAVIDPGGGPRLDDRYRPRTRVDLTLTIGVLQRGPRDPAQCRAGAVIWRASRTPEGPALVALRQDAAGDVRIAAWGQGRHWAAAQVPALCGADDDMGEFDASHHAVVAKAHSRAPGLRLTRTDLLFDALVPSVMEQKVTGTQAFGAWRHLVTRFGERVLGPSPRPMYAPPTVDGWLRIPSWAWHRAGVEPPQSQAIVRAARVGTQLNSYDWQTMPFERRDAVLTSVRGIGAWTAAETRARAFGDSDAVSVGDYHLAHEVGFALTGERTDDAGMLELLEPWRGQRQRVIRLIRLAGPHERRRGARFTIQDHRAN